MHKENQELDNQIDAGVDALVDITGQINQGAKEIGTELESQIEMCKDINEHMDQTDANINKATDKLKDVQAVGGSSICSWICMVILIILIIVALVIPKKVYNTIMGRK